MYSSEVGGGRVVLPLVAVIAAALVAVGFVDSVWVQSLSFGPLAERERERFGSGLEKADLERAFADELVLADELVETAIPQHVRAVLVDVDAVRRAWRVAIEPNAEGNLPVCSGREDEVRVARVEAVDDAPADILEQDLS
jgi:hypothetical protein